AQSCCASRVRTLCIMSAPDHLADFLVFFLMLRQPPRPALFPYTTLFRSAAVSHLLSLSLNQRVRVRVFATDDDFPVLPSVNPIRSEEHTSELQSRENLVCRLLLEKKKKIKDITSRAFRRAEDIYNSEETP